VLCAELSNPTWTPWGSIETEVGAAELRSVRDELVWAAGTASLFAAFFVASGALLRGGAVSVASVPSDSMAPGVRRGDALLVDRRRASLRAVAAGDVVLFAPPPRLASVILETRGSAPKSGELFVKRVVAVAGDELEIVRGAVFRNGSRETPYVTGTPVGVTAAEANADEAIASTATRDEKGKSKNENKKNGHPLQTCDVCKTASYDLRPTRVPPGNVFVLGDNRGGSVDGHVWGYLPLENVRGVVRFRVGPLSRFGALEKTPVPF
jgi:signal peptidase I